MEEKNLTKTIREKIIAHITDHGAITMAEYMEFCLSGENGYYKKQKPFGIKGDFITAPEISQLFGEMLAIWLIHTYQAFIKDKEFILCEMGPGRGTLMGDILRCFKKVAPKILEKAEILLIETSPKLQKEQKHHLSQFSHVIQWSKTLKNLPNKPLLLVANELLDALPVRQFTRFGKHVFEHKITYNKLRDQLEKKEIKMHNQEQVLFRKSLASYALVPFLQEESQLPIIFEISLPRMQLIKDIAEHINTYHGAALFIDYGALQLSYGDTIQAVRNHGYSSIFEKPGRDDISTHVDFHTLGLVTKKANCSAYGMTQGTFLQALGLLERADRLSINKAESIKEKIQQDVFRLIAPEQMGTLFKTFAIVPHSYYPFPYSEKDRL